MTWMRELLECDASGGGDPCQPLAHDARRVLRGEEQDPTTADRAEAS
jgi:hypothetical protein